MIIKSKFKNYRVEFRSKINLNFFKLHKDNIYIIDKEVYKKFSLKKFKIKRKILINASEKKKEFLNLYQVIDILFKLKIKRNDIVISIGGGTVQDISSFI